MNLAQFATWHRLLHNGYEPANQIKLTGELSSDGKTYIVLKYGVPSLSTMVIHLYQSIVMKTDNFVGEKAKKWVLQHRLPMPGTKCPLTSPTPMIGKNHP